MGFPLSGGFQPESRLTDDQRSHEFGLEVVVGISELEVGTGQERPISSLSAA